MALDRLRTSALIFILAYVFVLYVASVTSGKGLMKESWAYYAALGPLLSAGCFLTSSYMQQPRRRMLYAGIPAHVFAVAALFMSFLGLGFGLIVVAYFWWRAYVSSKSECRDE
jgi:hypothetical protein